jgi:hypothetical protein
VSECEHEKHRLAMKRRIEPLRRWEADSIGGHYEVVWCEDCGAIKSGSEPWQSPRFVTPRVVVVEPLIRAEPKED